MSTSVEPRIVIIGAGMAGILSVIKFREAGYHDLVVYEKTDRIGGTWRENTYPGIACDVPAHLYTYSFEPNPDWSSTFASGPEIQRYFERIVEKYDVRPAIRFNEAVDRCEFIDGRWRIRTSTGRDDVADIVIAASGVLHHPFTADIPGLESFAGARFHSAQWDHSVPLEGKRVGVIGTGSSGIQVIPRIAEQARQLTVFQRTANFSLPAWNIPMPAEYEAWFKAHYPARREKARYSSAGIACHPTPDTGALEVADDQRAKVYEAGWAHGGPGFTRIYKDILSNEKANETMAEFVRDKIRQKVKDPAVAALLTPTDHAIGTKRICVDTDYYETYNRDNVKLVNVREHPIEEITPMGLRTTEKEYELDAIVFATGYDAVTGAILNIDIRVDGGSSLAEKWAHGPKTYLGLMTAGYPNLFMVTGPGSPSVLTNMITSIEQHIEWIADCLRYLGQKGVQRMEAQVDYEEAWVRHVNEVADTTLFPRANSWYTGANIPGKARVFLPYVGGHGVYRMKCADVAFKGYEGFTLQC